MREVDLHEPSAPPDSALRRDNSVETLGGDDTAGRRDGGRSADLVRHVRERAADDGNHQHAGSL